MGSRLTGITCHCTLKTGKMIDIEKYKLILQEGLLLDHYVLLCNINEGKEIVSNKRIQGFLNLLHKKGYVEEDTLTQKAFDLLGGKVEPRIVLHESKKKVKRGEEDNYEYANWVIQLHRKCELKLVQKTGKRQVRDKIGGKAYSFLPNPTDLGNVILRAIQAYKLKDLPKIEATILNYIDRCAKSNNWFPILGYYIIKGANNTGGMFSQMVTDMDSDEEESADNTSIHIV